MRGNMGGMLLMALLLAAGPAVRAQQEQGKGSLLSGASVAVTFSAERGKVADANCECFWLLGPGADFGVNIRYGIGAAAALYEKQAVNLGSGESLNKISYLFGPRYTWSPSALPGALRSGRIFGEALFGGVHGYNGAFPAAGGLASSATAFALQAGGGFDLLVKSGFGLRLLEADYVYSQLPNNGSGEQNDFRIASGVSWHFR